MRLPHVPARFRFAAAFGLCVVFGFGAVLAFAAELKNTPHHHPHTRVRVTHSCASVTCAKVGDSFSIVLQGHITQVSEPQPGVRCIQIQERTHAGDFCAAS